MTILFGKVPLSLVLEKKCWSMNQSRLRSKSALTFCQHNENQMRADALARSMMNNDNSGKMSRKLNVSLLTNVDGSVGDTDIAET